MPLQQLSGNYHTIYGHWVRILKSAQHSIHIVVKDKLPPDWVFRLAPSILCTLDRGVKVSVLYYTEKTFPNDSQEDDFQHRIHLLACMGCTVRVREKTSVVPLTGIGMDLKKPGLAEIIHHFDLIEGTEGAGIMISNSEFLWLFDFFKAQFSDANLNYSPPGGYKLKFANAGVKRATQFLSKKNNGSLHYSDRTFTERYVKFDQLQGQDHPLRQWKVDQIGELEKLHIRHNLVPFAAVYFNLTNGNDEIMQGVLIEQMSTVSGNSEEGYFIAEGHTRATYLLNKNEGDTILALVLEGPGQGPPSELTDLSSMIQSDSNFSTKINPMARYIERYSRDGKRWAVKFEKLA